MIMLRRLLISSIAVFAASFVLAAQDYAIEILPDKKVIYVDKMGLAPTTSLQEVLHMMPELLDRSDEDLFANFDIQYEGKSTREGRYVVLSQTRVGELEKIEITDSPTVAQQKNGQGGVINIVPKHLDDGVSGEASLAASTEWNVMPGVYLNYRKNKLELRGSLNLEYYAPAFSRPSDSYSPKLAIHTLDTLWRQYLQETAKVTMKYSFSDRDVLEAWVIESWMKNSDNRNIHTTEIMDMSQEMGEQGWYLERSKMETSSSLMKNMSIATMAKYSHTFKSGSKLNVASGYEFNKEDIIQSLNDYSSTLYKPHSLSLEAGYEKDLYNQGDRTLNFETGLNTNYNHSYSTTQEGGNIYLSPYVNVKYKTGAWTLHAGTRYQCYMREYAEAKRDNFRQVEHDVTANINAVWQISPAHALRFVALRNIIRPTDDQLYPSMVFDYNQNMWRKGNPDLKTAYIHTLSANYIFDWKSDEGRHLVFNIGMGYDRADNIIERHIVDGGQPSGSGVGLALKYFTYENTGINNILKSDLTLFYTKGIFSMAFSGNLFCNFMHKGGEVDRYNYYNLSYTPIFNFRRQWVLSSKIAYNGPVDSKDVYMGDCFFMQIRLSKTIRRWTINAEISDIFDYESKDYSRSGDRIYVTTYDLYARYIGLGFTYHFGK